MTLKKETVFCARCLIFPPAPPGSSHLICKRRASRFERAISKSPCKLHRFGLPAGQEATVHRSPGFALHESQKSLIINEFRATRPLSRCSILERDSPGECREWTLIAAVTGNPVN
jgi:hypothetical protein